MMIETSHGPMDLDFLKNYFKSMVNRFFKILPLKENGDATLPVYIESFQGELLGCKELVNALQADSQFVSLLAILQYLADTPELSTTSLRREVFRAISICNKLSAKYTSLKSEEAKQDGRVG